MLIREVYLNENLIGYIGWNNGIVEVRADKATHQLLLEGLIGGIQVEKAQMVGNISISTKSLVLPVDEEWLSHLEELQVEGLTYGVVTEVTKNKFSNMPV